MKNYDQILYDILKPLARVVPLYLNDVPVDENSQPKDFVLFRTGISNTAKLYGDGKVLLRRCACDVLAVEQGDGNNSTSGYLFDAVEQVLTDNNIKYTRTSSGYNKDTDDIQVAFDFFL